MRCNLIPVHFLTDQHLIAEKRELRMIPALLKKRIFSGKHTEKDIPKQFTLGPGHMKFFLNKMLYLFKRYDLIVDEMVQRGFNVDKSLMFEMSYAVLLKMDNDWKPEPQDYEIIIRRLREKLFEKPSWYRYWGAPIDKNWIEKNYPVNTTSTLK